MDAGPGRPSPTMVPVGGGRRMALDDIGAPDGVPVVYLHGTPDSRLARHPDDAVAAGLGVRLLALDRPGCGQSDSHPGRTLGSVADDVAAVCSHLGIDRAAVLAWSAGAPYAVALGARHPDLVTAVGLVAPLVPVTAYTDPAVRTACDAGRLLFAEMAAEMAPEDVAVEVAPLLVPDPATEETVAEQLREQADAARTAELAGVPGAFEQLVAATVEAVSRGYDGLVQDVVTQATPPDVDLAGCRAPTTIWVGTADPVAPPAFGRWWARMLPGAEVEEVEGGSHALAFPHWAEILTRLARTAGL